MELRMINGILLFAILCPFLLGCITIKKDREGSETLLFENYSKEMVLPIGFYSINNEIILDSVLLDKDSLLYPKPSQKIVGPSFDFLCNLDLINRWSIFKNEDDINPYSNIFDEFLESRKQNLKLFCLGEVMVSDKFRSFLILSIEGEDNEFFFIRNLYLLNVSSNKCKSITRIASYTCFDGVCNYIFTERTTNIHFIQREIEVGSDVIMNEKHTTQNTPIKFKFNKNGMLKTL